MRKYSKRVVRYIWMPLKIAVLRKILPIKKRIYLTILIKKKIRNMVIIWSKIRIMVIKRKIIWFNPPFCRLASINLGNNFLKLIDNHFKHDNILHKIFNRKTLQISYSSTKNIFQIINNHNKEIIKEFQDRANNNDHNSKQNEYNCKTRNNCPMNGLCNLNNVVYLGMIYPKVNIMDRKTYIEFPPRNGKLDTQITNILSPTNIWNTKQPNLSNSGVWKIKS